MITIALKLNPNYALRKTDLHKASFTPFLKMDTKEHYIINLLHIASPFIESRG